MPCKSPVSLLPTTALAALMLAAAPMTLAAGVSNTPAGATHTAPAPASQTLGTQPHATHADGKLVCDNKTYTLSTGTGSGSCVSGVGNGDCKDGANSSSATCKGGCGPTTGKGSCTGG